jgi:hypothetical protein
VRIDYFVSVVDLRLKNPGVSTKKSTPRSHDDVREPAMVVQRNYIHKEARQGHSIGYTLTETDY